MISEERLKEISALPEKRDLMDHDDKPGNYTVGREMAKAVRDLLGERRELLLQISEMLSKIEKFKCSERAEECTARHMGYNLAIDDVLEVLRSPEKPNEEVENCPDCNGSKYKGEPCRRCSLKRKYDSNEHAHTCTQLGAYDCPHCGNCPDCGGKRKDALPGMEKALAEKAHQTEQAAHKPNECQHPPMEMCPNCDLI